VASLTRDLEKTFRSHVLEHAREVCGEAIVEAVGENPLPRLLVRSVTVDQPIKRSPRVEQARVQRTRGVSLHPGHLLAGF
jgi:hypothetical protein